MRRALRRSWSPAPAPASGGEVVWVSVRAGLAVGGVLPLMLAAGFSLFDDVVLPAAGGCQEFGCAGWLLPFDVVVVVGVWLFIRLARTPHSALVTVFAVVSFPVLWAATGWGKSMVTIMLEAAVCTAASAALVSANELLLARRTARRRRG